MMMGFPFRLAGVRGIGLGDATSDDDTTSASYCASVGWTYDATAGTCLPASGGAAGSSAASCAQIGLVFDPTSSQCVQSGLATAASSSAPWITVAALAALALAIAVKV